MSNYRLHLSFLAATPPMPHFRVYRKLRRPEEASPSSEIRGYSLNVTADQAKVRASYLVSLTEDAGFFPYDADARDNLSLTKWVLLRSLAQRCATVCGKGNYRAFEQGFDREVAICIERHPEGEEEIVFKPYFLQVTGNFGFLVDYHFRRKREVPFSRRILQLSLSLDQQNRLNANFYADKITKVEGLLQSHFHDLFPLSLPGSTKPLEFARSFPALTGHLLDKKKYIVGREQVCSGPFGGISTHGPWQSVPECPLLIFIFREDERQAARELVRAIRGQSPRLNFSGFENLFKVPLPVSDKPVVLQDFSKAEMDRALREIRAAGPKALPVLILPHAEGEDAYATHKAIFTNAGISTQVCTTDTIADDYTLKWSVGNIALQIFCKAGGQPWKMKPTDERCLIIGLGQSHKRKRKNGRETIEKYFAFSVLTDSSGLFQSIEVLSHADSEGAYIEGLKAKLAGLLKTKAQEFSKVVLHTPFKLKHAEMRVLEDVVSNAAKESASCKFVVLKVNQRNRFFAVNRDVNSLVPYEGSYLQLSPREFLLWFEGLFPDKPKVTKAVPGPTHVEFLRVSDQSLIGDGTILQDLLNLSGANWRGFNAKSTPVSVLYCQLIADMLHEFQARNLPMPPIKEIHPWFL
jgi:hypothetical protein